MMNRFQGDIEKQNREFFQVFGHSRDGNRVPERVLETRDER